MTEPESEERRDLIEVLLEEYLARHRRGEAEPIGRYVDGCAEAHPDDAVRIRDQLPALTQLAVDLEAASAPAGETPLLEPGLAIRHYRVERFVARGGMGEVYLAENTKLGADVAIKLLKSSLTDDPQLLAAFEREARVAAHLRHPNIATVHDLFEVDGRHYLVMEFVEGRSLRDLVKEQAPVPLATMLDLGGQIAQALAFAHGKSVVHRDLKPDNVMITPDGRVKILDFGLAKVDGPESAAGGRLGTSVFPSGTTLGTVDYMSPEQARGYPVDARSDLFALGVILYEMATGVAPFHKATFADTVSSILTDRPASAVAVNRDLPPRVAKLIDKLLSKEPEDRYQSAEAVLEELEALGPAGAQKSGRSRWILVPLAAAALLIFWIWPEEQPAPAPDPGIAQLTAFLDRDVVPVDDLVEARRRLEELEGEFGPEKAELAALRLVVKEKVAAVLEKGLAHLEIQLAAGDRTAAARQLEHISKLDEANARARELMELAKRYEDGVRVNRDRVMDCLDRGELRKAWTTITVLQGGTFEGRGFRPARDAAQTMREKLIEKLKSKLGENPPIETFEDHVALLREVHPSDPDLEKLDERLAELHKEREVTERLEDNRDLLAAADPARLFEVTHDEAQEIERRLEALLAGLRDFPESRQKNDLRELLEAWKSARAVYEAFVRLDRLSDERRPVQAAMEWQARYAQAANDAAVDPVGARTALQRLRAESPELAPRFRDGAEALLGRLEVEITTAEADAHTRRLIQRAQDLVRAIVERSRKLQGPTPEQRERLERIEAEIEDPTSLFDPATRALERLEKQREETERLERQYEVFRKALRSATADAATARGLEEGWLAEKRILDQAIEYEPAVGFDGLDARNAQLHWRRAVVNLRLRRYQEALEDVRESGRGRTLEGLLLSGMAKFGDGRDHEAREDFAAAVRLDERSARAHYWLGTSTRALKHLARAVELDDGLADAHQQMAVLYLDQGRSGTPDAFSRAIASATRRLSSVSPLDEDEMVAVFQGHPLAEYPRKAKKDRCGVHLVRAAAHFEQGDLRACIEDCDRSETIDPTVAEAYLLRASAHARLKDLDAARADVDKAMRYAAKGSDVLRQAEELRKQIGGR